MSLRTNDWRIWTVAMAVAARGSLACSGAAVGSPPGRGSPRSTPSATGLELIGQRPLITGLNGVVTSNQPLASAAGLRILNERRQRV